MTLVLSPRPVRGAGRLRALLRATRPRQWGKNLLVLAAPGAAGVVLAPSSLLRTAVVGAAFVAASSACYLLNDVVDRQADAVHPRKRHRPVASGALPVPTALAAAAVLAVVGLALAAAVPGWSAVVVAAYLGTTVAYGLGLKTVPVLEVVVVASGFVLRMLAGATAAGVVVSGWFALVAAAAALHVAASKRASELRVLGAAAAAHRTVLSAYTHTGLRALRQATVAVTVFAYAAWAWTRPVLPGRWVAVASLLPLVVALARWTVLTEAGAAEAPELLVLHDRVVRGAALAWSVAFAVCVLLVQGHVRAR